MLGNKKTIRLNAFTLIELAITLIITGIVIAFTIASFQIISNLHSRFKEKTERINQFEKLRFLLSKDNIESSKIIKQNNGFSFVKDSIIIEYQVSDNYIIRQQSQKKDTFILKELSFKTSFQNREEFNYEKIDLITLFLKNDKHIIINKEYAAKELMKSN